MRQPPENSRVRCCIMSLSNPSPAPPPRQVALSPPPHARRMRRPRIAPTRPGPPGWSGPRHREPHREPAAQPPLRVTRIARCGARPARMVAALLSAASLSRASSRSYTCPRPRHTAHAPLTAATGSGHSIARCGPRSDSFLRRLATAPQADPPAARRISTGSLAQRGAAFDAGAAPAASRPIRPPLTRLSGANHTLQVRSRISRSRSDLELLERVQCRVGRLEGRQPYSASPRSYPCSARLHPSCSLTARLTRATRSSCYPLAARQTTRP